MNRQKVSAFVVCCNEEERIRACLESICWCDELIVVDSGSTDQTLHICREYTSSIIQKDWGGYVEQKQFALDQCSYSWILNIDADEILTPELQKSIEAVLESDGDQGKYNGYEISRVVFYLGRWWKKGGWYPEYRLRLCRREATTWGGSNPHEKAIVNGKVGKLEGDLEHYTYEDITDQMRSLNNHSTVAAQSLYEEGKRSSLFQMISRSLSRFFKFYILRKGFREGLAGFMVGILEAQYVFLKYAKLRELEKKK